MPTLVVVVVHVAHMRRVMQPGTEDRPLYGVFSRDTFGLVFGGAIVEKCHLWRDSEKEKLFPQERAVSTYAFFTSIEHLFGGMILARPTFCSRHPHEYHAGGQSLIPESARSLKKNIYFLAGTTEPIGYDFEKTTSPVYATREMPL